MTYLSSLHPYPAMIANDLAAILAQRYVVPGSSVLDPFCGTGRTLLAAQAALASQVVGADVNPLATMIARAKLASVSVSRIQRFAESALPKVKHVHDFETRKVRWFSKRSSADLTQIIEGVNRAYWLHAADRLLIAAVLSATARHVSFCRNDQWKLHRVTKSMRQRRIDAKAVFFRRLEVAIREIAACQGQFRSKARVISGSCTSLRSTLATAGIHAQFDVVMTSPPYGDSFTTVQYGGMSSICLQVIRYLNGVTVRNVPGREIDRLCLGGPGRAKDPGCHIREYWAGGLTNPNRSKVVSFFLDMGRSCQQIAQVTRPGGYAILVLGRRRTGGFRVRLDRFVIDCMCAQGFQLADQWERPLQSKRLPSVINRLGRRRNHSRGAVATMRSEYVVVLRRR